MASLTGDVSEVARLQSEQTKKDAHIDSLLERIVQNTEQLEDDDMSYSDKYDIILANEYLLTRLRFIVTDEMIRVEHGLTIDNKETPIKAFYTKRRTYLSVINARLNEIREDMNVLQKTAYLRERF